jgi:serine/threonine protein phosphatase PrpC
MRDGLAALLQQAQQQQQVCGGAEQQQQGRLLAQQQQQQQQMVVVDACCDGSSDDCSSAMEVDGAAAAAVFKPHPQQQQQQDWDISGACSSAASDVFIAEDSETLASSTLSLLPHGQQQQQQRLRRIPRSSSASTLSSVQDTGLGFGAAGDNSSSHSSKPLSTEAANAAAAAAAAAAVPASASLQGVLSLTAAAAAAGSAAAAATVESGAFGALGPRESMEDRHVVVQGLGGDARVTLAAVFDGHRGHEAAAYAAAQLPRNLLLASVLEGSSSSNTAVHGASREQPAADASTGAALALKRSFLATDAAFWQEWQAEMHAHATAGQYTERYPGCTALAAVLAGSQLFVGNAGDGRAVLSRGGTAVPLSRQHTADLQDERERVVASGGTVAFRGGSWRVGSAALQVTRALGDFDLKVPAQQPSQQQQQQRYSPYSCNPLSSSSMSSSSSSTPVTAEPEVVSLQLSSVDQFLILGTDGLWDVIGDQEAVGLVHDTVKDPFLCAKRLVMEALSRGSSDNVSAVVLFLQPKHTLERVWVRGGGAAVPAATPTFYGSRRLTTHQAAEQAGDGAAAAAGPAGAADEMMDTY